MQQHAALTSRLDRSVTEAFLGMSFPIISKNRNTWSVEYFYFSYGLPNLILTKVRKRWWISQRNRNFPSPIIDSVTTVDNELPNAHSYQRTNREKAGGRSSGRCHAVLFLFTPDPAIYLRPTEAYWLLPHLSTKNTSRLNCKFFCV